NQAAGAVGDGGIPLNATPPYYPIIADKDSGTNGGDSAKAGSDILLTDVLSFQVMVLLPGGTKFVDLFDASMPAAQNSKFNTATQPRVFDTWSDKSDGTYDYSGWQTAGTATSLPLNTPISALQITLRIWDVK